MATRKQIPQETKLRLFSEAAGHCQHPECLRPLFPAEMGGDKHIAEMAHVIPHGEKGPRHEERPDGEFEADSVENLLLLCPTCHTTIDKEPDAYSSSTLLAWKSNHLGSLAVKQGVQAYEDRRQVRSVIIDAMAENKVIWKRLADSEGPDFEYDPESELATTWRQRARSVVLPNHFRLQAILRANRHLMSGPEHEVFALYSEHVRGLVERHVCGVTGGIRYPEQMDDMFA
ncbi:HNH endonuclease [Pseudomonas fulva]|uniref:HNH endonuclease n=1 Tax=Pseudomonas fulva TaxID=47880 RepID=UPI0037F70A45